MANVERNLASAWAWNVQASTQDPQARQELESCQQGVPHRRMATVGFRSRGARRTTIQVDEDVIFGCLSDWGPAIELHNLHNRNRPRSLLGPCSQNEGEAA